MKNIFLNEFFKNAKKYEEQKVKKDKILKLKNEIKELKRVNKEHKKLNGELRKKLNKCEEMLIIMKNTKMIEDNKKHIPEITENSINEYIKNRINKFW